jgi:hypothetical protein
MKKNVFDKVNDDLGVVAQVFLWTIVAVLGALLLTVAIYIYFLWYAIESISSW